MSPRLPADQDRYEPDEVPYADWRCTGCAEWVSEPDLWTHACGDTADERAQMIAVAREERRAASWAFRRRA